MTKQPQVTPDQIIVKHKSESIMLLASIAEAKKIIENAEIRLSEISCIIETAELLKPEPVKPDLKETPDDEAEDKDNRPA